jgi:hypothetical protein
MRVTPSTESEGACSTPIHATAGSLIAIGSAQTARQLSSLETVAERCGPQELSLGGGPSEVLGAAEIVEDKLPGAQPLDGVDPAPPSTASSLADTAAEPTPAVRGRPGGVVGFAPIFVPALEDMGPRMGGAAGPNWVPDAGLPAVTDLPLSRERFGAPPPPPPSERQKETCRPEAPNVEAIQAEGDVCPHGDRLGQQCGG